MCISSISVSKLIDLFKPDTYNYLLGDSILVAPVLSDPSDVSVTFPEGQWVAWWNDSLVYKEGEVARFTSLPLEVFPAFIKSSKLLRQLRVPVTGLQCCAAHTYSGLWATYLLNTSLNTRKIYMHAFIHSQT